MLTGKIGNEIINCYDGTHSKEQLKKWTKKKIILCPVCNRPYEYCHGKVKTPYFRHMDKEKCVTYTYTYKWTTSSGTAREDSHIFFVNWVKKQS